MEYIKSLKIYVTVFVLIMLLTILISLSIKEAVPMNYFAAVVLFIPIVIVVRVYFNTKYFYHKIFDYDFYDIHNKLGIFHEVAKGYSLTIDKKLLFFCGPTLYLYKNSMIIQVGDRAMYIDDLSKVKIHANYIKFNYNGIGCNTSFKYVIPKNARNIIENCQE